LPHERNNGVSRVVVVETHGHGGITQYSHDLCESLSRAGRDVTLVTTFGFEFRKRHAGYKVKRILSAMRPGGGGVLGRAANLLRHLYNFFALTAFLVPLRDCVIHYQWHLSRFFVAHLMLVRLFQGNLAYTAHNAFSHNDGPMWHGYFGKVYGIVDRVITLTQYTKGEILSRLPGLEGKISVVPLGNSGSLVKGCEERIFGGCSVVLFFGLIRKYKGLEVLLDAFNTVAEKCPAARLVVAGSITEKGMALRDYEGILRPDARSRTMFVTRYINAGDIPLYFRSADVVALPYVTASQSGVTQLAFSFGKPVVASRVGGLPEQVDDGKSGYLVRPGDPAELAEAVLKLLNDPAKAAAMGAYAKRVSDTRFGWDNIARQTIGVYEAGAGKSASRFQAENKAA